MNSINEQSTKGEIFDDFVVEITADGSPTARLKSDGINSIESMHNSQGAASETVYIYTQPFVSLLNNHHLSSLKVLVIGLGLAYIEFNLLNQILNRQSTLNLSEINITTYEKSNELREKLKNAITYIYTNTTNLEGIQQNVVDLYQTILKSVVQTDDLDQIKKLSQICHELLNLHKSSMCIHTDWTIKDELSLETKNTEKYHFIAYDAFSQKTDHPLWNEEFLNFFVLNFCANDCVFTTYACTGLLKRVLAQHGFKLIKRKGFKGKRDATLAVRGQPSAVIIQDFNNVQ